MEKRTITTGCGQGTMFGDMMDDLDNVQLPEQARLDRQGLNALLEAVRNEQTVYKQSGAVHGCGLASNDADGVRMLMFVEDVGRHNAVDAIAGQMWLDGLEGGDKVFYTTGRLTSEMVIKTAQMGIPFLISRSGLTQMGWEIARQTGITTIGRALGRHYLVYTGLERFSR
jgi:FdhD protein